jgi:hypothetical protein
VNKEKTIDKLQTRLTKLESKETSLNNELLDVQKQIYFTEGELMKAKRYKEIIDNSLEITPTGGKYCSYCHNGYDKHMDSCEIIEALKYFKGEK